MAEAGVDFPLVHASAGEAPFDDGSFDIVFCDHGAMTFADPYATVPEVARLLRPGGLFAFSHTTALSIICLRHARPTRPSPSFGATSSACTASNGRTRASRSSSTCRRASGSSSSAQNGFVDRGPRRGAAARGRESTYRSRRGDRVGAPLADGADLEAAQAMSLRHVERNRAEWTQWAADFAEWAPSELGARRRSPGASGTRPSRSSRVLPEVDGKDVVELGCGTAYVSAWLARRGARVVGVDIDAGAARDGAADAGASSGSSSRWSRRRAEDVPLPDASFDLAVSEYGASIWADPYRWIPEAARLLRPGGHLVFLVNGDAHELCAARRAGALRDGGSSATTSACTGSSGPDDESRQLLPRLRRLDPAPPRQRARGRAPRRDPGARGREAAPVRDAARPDWARRWPSEEIWVARKRA